MNSFREYFTIGKSYQEVIESFPEKKVDIILKDVDGNTIFFGENLIFPEHFSQRACEIIASKYFYKNETSYYEMIKRMINFWSHALLDEGILDAKSSLIFRKEAAYTLLSQMWSPNSPQYFNSGIGFYGIKNDNEELWYWDPEKEESVRNTKGENRSQSSACFILGIEDALLGPNSITDHYITETKLFKGGSGVGTNFSKLRGEGEKISSGGTSSGVLSFLDGLDKNAGAIKSGGTTRRAAKMVILDIDHPDIEKFIDWKIKEEQKARALIDAGYSGGMLGEAYSTVSGQNSNNSVRLNAEFMKTLKKYNHNSTVPQRIFELKGRVDGSVDKWIDPYELWEKIAYGAWLCGDPGIQFDDTFNEWNTCANDGIINATNPCSEYAFLDNTACNLASINIPKVLKLGDYQINDFKQVITICQYVLEASIHYGQFPTPEVAANSYKYRPTGLGIANLASFLMENGLPYDSEEARTVVSVICSLLTGYSYKISNELAKKVGPFERYHDNETSMREVLNLHRCYTHDIEMCDSDKYLDSSQMCDIDIMHQEAIEIWEDVCTLHNSEIGFRNAQVTVMAPTGTISFAMDCDATGIEPFFAHVMYKKLSDGSVMEIVNNSVINFLRKCDYSELGIEKILNQIKEGIPIQDIHMHDDYKEVLKTANEISPEGHVKMMAAIQPFISGSISKTVNLPNDATVEDVMRIYEMAYDLGCKSITVYRDGSKGTQPLSRVEKKEKTKPIVEDTDKNIDTTLDNTNTDKTLENNTLKRIRPKGIRSSHTHEAKIGDVELYITIGFYDNGDMSEIFVSTDKDGTTIKGLLAVLSKSISHMLQNGLTPKYISEILRDQKFEPNGVVSRHPYIKMASSISDLISKVIDYEIGDYRRLQIKPIDNVELNDLVDDCLGEDMTKEQAVELARMIVGLEKDRDKRQPLEIVKEVNDSYTTEPCPNCGMYTLKQSGTCKVCTNCGSTTGCS